MWISRDVASGRRGTLRYPQGRKGVRQAKHGFWDEEYGSRVDATPSPSAEDEFFAEPDPEPPCTQDELHAALKLLTARQAFVVRLYYQEELTQQEIAKIAGWHLSTVQEHLFAAEQKLHKILTGETRRNTP